MDAAVITGDIINSKKLPVAIKELLYGNLDKLLKQLSKNKKNFVGEVNRGDSFQCFLKNPEEALRYALIIKCYLKSFSQNESITAYSKSHSKKVPVSVPILSIDARIAIGIGDIEFISKRLATSDGEAFHISGILLERMKGTHRTIAASTKNPAWRKELHTMLILLDVIMRRNTSLQCQVIMRKLLGKKETEIAEELGILQSAVNQRSSAAGWHAIEAAVNRFTELINNIDKINDELALY